MTDMKNGSAPPVLFLHCNSVYKAMERKAERDPNTGVVLYEGFIVRLVTKECNLSVPMYSKVLTALKQMKCIRQVKRGGGSSPSLWCLIKPPELLDFKSRVPIEQQTSTVEQKQHLSERESLRKQVAALANQVGTLQLEVDKLKNNFLEYLFKEDVDGISTREVGIIKGNQMAPPAKRTRISPSGEVSTVEATNSSGTSEEEGLNSGQEGTFPELRVEGLM